MKTPEELKDYITSLTPVELQNLKALVDMNTVAELKDMESRAPPTVKEFMTVAVQLATVKAAAVKTVAEGKNLLDQIKKHGKK